MTRTKQQTRSKPCLSIPHLYLGQALVLLAKASSWLTRDSGCGCGRWARGFRSRRAVDLPRSRISLWGNIWLPWTQGLWQRCLSPNSLGLSRSHILPLEATKAPLPSLFRKTSGKSLASLLETVLTDRHHCQGSGQHPPPSPPRIPSPHPRSLGPRAEEIPGSTR